MYVEIILVFLDIILQHLQPMLAHPAECPSRLGVTVIFIGVVDFIGSVQFFNFALTSFCLRLLAFLSRVWE